MVGTGAVGKLVDIGDQLCLSCSECADVVISLRMKSSVVMGDVCE